MKKLIVTAALFTGLNTLLAQPTTWQIDPVHSSITFSVDYMVLTEVSGKFKEFSGTLERDGNDLTKGRFNVEIKTASISTDNEKRDGHLRSADFFDAEKFPQVSFVTKSIDKLDGNNYTVKGDLTMHGVTKPFVIAAVYAGEAKDPWGKTREGFKGTASVKRSEFGVKYNSALESGGVLISDDVKITLNMQFVKQQPAGSN